MNNVFNEYMNSEKGKVFAGKYKDVAPLEKVDCIVCGNKTYKTWYEMGKFKALVCKKCKTRFVSPRYNDEQLDKHYSKDLFTNSTDYEGRKHNMLNPEERKRKRFDMKEEIEALLNKCPEGGKVLDIGCQTGIFLEALPNKYKKYGIERSEWAAEICKDITKADIKCSKIEDAVFPDSFFDVINMSYVLEHLQYPIETMGRIIKWLKPGGVLVISVPNFLSPCSLLFKEFYRLTDPRQHIYLTDKRSIRFLCDKFNLKIANTYYPYFKTPYCSKKEIIRFFMNGLRRILLPLTIRLGVTPDITKVISPPFWGNIMTVVIMKNN